MKNLKPKCQSTVKKDPAYKLEKVSASKVPELPKITFLAERPVKYVEMDFDVPDEVLDEIAAYGMKLIKDDKNALFNYAFTKMLEDLCEKGPERWSGFYPEYVSGSLPGEAGKDSSKERTQKRKSPRKVSGKANKEGQ